jgi:exodeoxyribonuclease VII large subunit
VSNPIPVSALVAAIGADLRKEWGTVAVVAELGPPRIFGGIAYLTLKDKKASMSGIMFPRELARVPFDLVAGLEVVCRGVLDIYPPQGRFQIKVESMEPVGKGAQQLAQEQLEERLKEEGFFAPERKIPIPASVSRVGIVTSPDGAVIRDILSVIRRRCGGLDVLVYPARVQGDGADAQIAAGVQTLDALGLDVIIVARGGGSAEDLAQFNSETVVRAVGGCKTPIISAVGHETDFSLCDHAADLRAATPSAAAEIVSKDGVGLQLRVANARRALNEYPERLEAIATTIKMRRYLFEAHNPAAILKRGYVLITERTATGGRPIESIAAIKGFLPYSSFRFRFADGYMDATIDDASFEPEEA